MTLINGRFYVNGMEVPVEIGNKEQIALLKERQKTMVEGVDVNVSVDEVRTYTIRLTFHCPSCGRHNLYEDDGYEDEEFAEDGVEGFLNLDPECRYCKQQFNLGIRDGKYKYML